jgi:hypothetical protein
MPEQARDMADLPSVSYSIEAADIKRKPDPIIITPIPIFKIEEDS